MSARSVAPPASRAVRVTTVVAVGLVALVAALVSYAHMQEVAQEAGERWRAWLVPLSVDGLVVAASMVLLTRRRAGLPGGVLAWVALLGGVGASLAANVAAAEPTVTARVVAAWPAIAFGLGFELLLQQRTARPSADEAAAPVPVGAPVVGARVGEPVGEPAAMVDHPAPPVGDPVATSPPVVAHRSPTAAPAPAAPDSSGSPAHPVDREAAAVAALVATSRVTGRPVSRRTVARELGISEHRAGKLLAATNGRPR